MDAEPAVDRLLLERDLLTARGEAPPPHGEITPRIGAAFAPGIDDQLQWNGIRRAAVRIERQPTDGLTIRRDRDLIEGDLLRFLPKNERRPGTGGDSEHPRFVDRGADVAIRRLAWRRQQ